MSEIVVVARFKIREGAQEEAEGLFGELISASHGDKGCVRYALHRSKAEPTDYVLVERWASQADLDAHFTQPHMAEVGAKLGGVLDGGAEVTMLDPVVLGDPEKGKL